MNLESYSYVIIVIVQNYLPSNIFIQNLLIKKKHFGHDISFIRINSCIVIGIKGWKAEKNLDFYMLWKRGEKNIIFPVQRSI